MIETEPTPQEPVKSERGVPREQHRAQSSIDHVLDGSPPWTSPPRKSSSATCATRRG